MNYYRTQYFDAFCKLRESHDISDEIATRIITLGRIRDFKSNPFSDWNIIIYASQIGFEFTPKT